MDKIYDFNIIDENDNIIFSDNLTTEEIFKWLLERQFKDCLPKKEKNE